MLNTPSGHHFTHIYVEEAATRYPDTDRILGLHPHATVVPIADARALFNRRDQHFQAQKNNPKLILSVDRGPYLYRGSERVQSFGAHDVYYVAPIRNCVYNCEYCFLQGMHASGDLLVTVNNEDILQAAAARYRDSGGYFLSISYLTDLMAFENLLPFCRRWIEFAREHPELLLEIRTKSDNVHALHELKPVTNVVLVWSLSPEPVSRKHERGAASFRNRLLAARTAQQSGWRLRLCFDPVLRVPGWEDLYHDCITETFRRLNAEAVEQVSYGVFRLHGDFLDRMRKLYSHSPLLHADYQRRDHLTTYGDEQIEEMRRTMQTLLLPHLDASRITFVHG